MKLKASTIVILGAILFILLSEKEGANAGTGSGSGTTSGGTSANLSTGEALGGGGIAGVRYKFAGEIDSDYNEINPNVAHRTAGTFMSQSPEGGIPVSANPAEMLLVSGRGRVSGIRHAPVSYQQLQSIRENDAFKNFAASRY